LPAVAAPDMKQKKESSNRMQEAWSFDANIF
jgi:hypothetical protein